MPATGPMAKCAPRLLRLARLLLGLVLILAAGSSRAETDFILGPGDKLLVSVHKRPDLSGEFRVLPTGILSLPLVRSLPVSGRPLTEIRQLLVERLREDAFLLDPRVTIDVVEMRPIFVSGDVRRPGTYGFQMGMTVLHAISVAGGLRSLDLEEFGAQMEVGRLREKLRQAQETVGLAMIRRGRLVAERADGDDFPRPPEIRSFLTEEKATEAHGSERALLIQRNDAFRKQLAVIGSPIGVYREEIDALTEQISAKLREEDLITQESRYVENLQRQGLTPRTSRVLELRRLAVQIEGERHQLAFTLAKAKQEIARAEQTLSSLAAQRLVDITAALKEADDAISHLKVTIEESRSSLIEAREKLPGPGGPVGARTPVEFTILRTRGDGNVSIAARGDTPVLPGDLIDVPRR